MLVCLMFIQILSTKGLSQMLLLIVVDRKHDNVTILRKDFYNLSYSYHLDEHTTIKVVKKLIETNDQ